VCGAAGADAGAADGGAGVLYCQPASPTDGVKNDSETDTDCGGALLADGTPNSASDGAPVCTHGMSCLVGPDCDQGACNSNGDMGGGPIDCPTGTSCVCQFAAANDGVQNGGETDVDCGGSSTPGSDGAPPCAAGLHCLITSDCASLDCTGAVAATSVSAAVPGVCQPATCSDGIQNEGESDVDCGGPCPPCAVGKACMQGTDCKTAACNYANVCVSAQSCVGHEGGDTCGLGESINPDGTTNPMITSEDCCVGATVTASHGTVTLDKYKVTSGRMRAFMNAVKGNVRGFIQQQRAIGFMAGVTMPAAWDLYLPTAMDGCDVLGNCPANELSDYFVAAQTLAQSGAPFQGIFTSAYRWLGSSLFHGQSLPQQGCNISAPGSHTYWMDDDTQSDYFGDLPADYPQALYDTRALNCVPYLIAQAFCVWDGGRLEFFDEWRAAWGSAAYPWGASPAPSGGVGASSVGPQYKFPTATDASLRAMYPGYAPGAGSSIEYADYSYSYEYPDLGPNNDYVVFIAAPGRQMGRGPYGHADIIGIGMEVTSDITSNTGDPRTSTMDWASNGSFEGHPWSTGVEWSTFSLVNRYGKQGLRCARPAP
jgi:hypothetical protein